jgi:chorismate mutase/prephenate dehydratase
MDNKKNLTEIRVEIDKIDNKITELLKQRSQLIPHVAEIKHNWQQKIAFKREMEQKEAIDNTRDFGLYNKLAMQKIWRELISATLKIECNLAVGIFAPQEDIYNFWELTKDHFGVSANLILYKTLEELLMAIESKKINCGVVAEGDVKNLTNKNKDIVFHLTLPQADFLTLAKAQNNNNKKAFVVGLVNL